jgi:hypothetical protein
MDLEKVPFGILITLHVFFTIFINKNCVVSQNKMQKTVDGLHVPDM